jgi:DNA-binding CsgD family transcriptional regulator
LRRLADGVREGQSGVIVVRGEPGAGKTALLRQLEKDAPDFQVLRGVGVESEMELSFAGLHQMCAPLIRRLSLLPEPQRRSLSVALGLAAGDKPDQFLVAMATLSLLAKTAEEGPLLCVVDDVHWLDRASARVLGFIGRHVPTAPIALVLATRLESGEDYHLPGLPELRLSGLDEESAGALLRTIVPGPVDDSVRRRIVAETRGNPRALLELCQGQGSAELAGGFALPSTAGLPESVTDQHLARLRQLPLPTRQLLLLAAADMTAETSLIYRAAGVLGLDTRASAPAAAAGLIEISATMLFRHSLMRPVVYRSADATDRQAVHSALAAATDPEGDPDRRAWHRAHAAAGPDEAVAQELASSAERARRRGGAAAAAAFWEQATALTPEPGDRATRALTAAEAKFAAGDFTSAHALLAITEAGPASDLDRARARRLSAHAAFALRRGRDAPRLLLQAGQRLQNLDAGLAQQACLEAFIAAIYAGRLAREADIPAIAEAAGQALLTAEPSGPVQLLLRGFALRLTEGHLAAAPLMRQALDCRRSHLHQQGWLGVACSLVAMDLWDDNAWSDTAARMVTQAREDGDLVWLPFALDYLAEQYIHAGDLPQAAALLAESQRFNPRIETAALPRASLLHAAWRGDETASSELALVMTRGAAARGEGAALTYADYATAVLNNGLGRYDLAAEAALAASTADELAISSWALPELAEAAARAGHRERAAAVGNQLSAIASAGGTSWVRGVAAWSKALALEGRAAEESYAEAIGFLAKTSVTTQLARVRLSYGEWLRREKRRTEARDQLRSAYWAFHAMGAQAFADRAKRELQATGERIRGRGDPHTDLTPQEEQIARLAREGQSNQEISTQLFIGSRTVEWHLRNIFVKLDIASRRELDKALSGHAPAPSRADTPPSP